MKTLEHRMMVCHEFGCYDDWTEVESSGRWKIIKTDGRSTLYLEVIKYEVKKICWFFGRKEEKTKQVYWASERDLRVIEVTVNQCK